MPKAILSEKDLIKASITDGLEADNDAANYSFAQRVVRCYVTRVDTVATAGINWKYKLNATSAGEASATNFDGIVNDAETVDVSRNGTHNIKDISIFFEGVGSAPVDQSEVAVMGIVG